MTPQQLNRYLNTHYNMEELRQLCLELGVDDEQFDNSTKGAFVRELVLYYKRRDKLDVLEQEARREATTPLERIGRQFGLDVNAGTCFIRVAIAFSLIGVVLIGSVIRANYIDGEAQSNAHPAAQPSEILTTLRPPLAGPTRTLTVPVTPTPTKMVIISPTPIEFGTRTLPFPLPDGIRDQVSSVQVDGGCVFLDGSAARTFDRLHVCEDIPLLDSNWSNTVWRVAADCASGPGRITVTLYVDGEFTGENVYIEFCE